MKFRFNVTDDGHIRDVKITSNIRNRWAEETARRALLATRLPPVPKEVLALVGHNGLYSSAQLKIGKRQRDQPIDEANGPVRAVAYICLVRPRAHTLQVYGVELSPKGKASSCLYPEEAGASSLGIHGRESPASRSVC